LACNRCSIPSTGRGKPIRIHSPIADSETPGVIKQASDIAKQRIVCSVDIYDFADISRGYGSIEQSEACRVKPHQASENGVRTDESLDLRAGCGRKTIIVSHTITEWPDYDACKQRKS